jgi:gluconate kinase
MPASLLDSQLAALEAPQGAIVVAVDRPPAEIVASILIALGRA